MSTSPPGDEVRVLVVTDSDSYVKYGAALAGRLPTGWRPRLVVVRGNALPGARQIDEALEGSALGAADVMVVDRLALRTLLDAWRPDVLVAAARGMTVEAVLALVGRRVDRPVVVTALPGVSIPPQLTGLRLREGCDVFVVHSRRELRETREAAQRAGLRHRFELARLPFLAPPVRSRQRRDRIVFAAQAQVPSGQRDRRWLLERLVETAIAHPRLQVVVKLRAHPGEAQTHVEQFSFEDLLLDLVDEGRQIPANLVIDVGAMSGHLTRAIGMVTVSSTAVLEAVAADVPSLVLDDFGVGAAQINAVFADSGLIGSTDDLVAARFRAPDPAWLDDNYLHADDADTWIDAVRELLAVRASTGLPAITPRHRGLGVRVRRAVYQRLAFSGTRAGLVLHPLFVRVASTFEPHRRRWRAR